MANVLFSIKLRERLACRAVRIQCVGDLKDELKPDCLLKTSILWKFGDEFVTLTQLTTTEQSRLKQHQTTPVFTGETQPTVETKARLPLQTLPFNAISTSNTPIQKTRRRPEKQDRPRMHRERHDFELNMEERENTKAKADLQKRDDNAQSKKKKAALAHRDNNERI